MAAQMNCPECNEPLFYTGEMQPKLPPNRYYACVSKHVVLLLDCEDEPDWGDGSITRAWREALNTKGGIEEYEFIAQWKSSD